MKDERLVSKMESKTNFSRRLKQSDLTDRDPLIIRQIYAIAIEASLSQLITTYQYYVHQKHNSGLDNSVFQHSVYMSIMQYQHSKT